MSDANGPTLYIRPEFVNKDIAEAAVGDVARRLSLIERLTNVDPVRKFSVLLVVVVAWELYTRLGDVPPLIFPTFTDTAIALVRAFTEENLLGKVWNSMQILLTGYGIGIAIAAALTMIAVSTRIGSDLLTTLTAMLNPLPAIALLPLAMLWFGLGDAPIVFTLLHSVIWPLALNTHTGFMGVSETQRMVGRNYGLKGIRYVCKILIPAAFPSILTGLRIAWAFAWRTLIAAELVFGGAVVDTAGNDAGGLGWYVFESQMDLRVPHVFAGLFTVILVGILVENVIFRNVEEHTVNKWGMQT